MYKYPHASQHILKNDPASPDTGTKVEPEVKGGETVNKEGIPFCPVVVQSAFALVIKNDITHPAVIRQYRTAERSVAGAVVG